MSTKLFGINNEWAFGSILALAVLAFAFSPFPAAKWPPYAMLGFAAIVLLFLTDAAPAKLDSSSFKDSLKELAIALGMAIAVWLALQLVLGTSSPLDVVTSCSMLPVLERGDLIVVRNTIINVPTANITGSLKDAISTAQAAKDDCLITTAGVPKRTKCTKGVYIQGKYYAYNSSNDIVVFEPTPRYLGLIVHRSFLRLANGTDELYLTKGDNNLGLDQEAGIGAVPRKDIHGAVITRIPLVGYLKLFLFMQFEEPYGCKVEVLGGN